MMLLAQVQAAVPLDACFITGFCPVPEATAGVAPGVMFVAVGLVLYGVAGLRRSRRNAT